jgi:hypothetical protein
MSAVRGVNRKWLARGQFDAIDQNGHGRLLIFASRPLILLPSVGEDLAKHTSGATSPDLLKRRARCRSAYRARPEAAGRKAKRALAALVEYFRHVSPPCGCSSLAARTIRMEGVVMDIRVVQGDALEISADVLVLKYAQMLYGVDELVVNRLEATRLAVRDTLPKPDGFRLVDTGGQLAAKSILFVGVVPLQSFRYEAIREFSKRALTSLAGAKPAASHVAFTLHGAGYGLDEAEAFRAELAGILDAVETGDCPSGIKLVTIVEFNAGRARRLQTLLDAILRGSTGNIIATAQLEQIQSAGAPSRTKPHVFVAMPFAPEFDDHFHYGIQQAVNAAGYLCERADLAAFTGDVIAWVKERIDSAHLLVADLSTANPNVYLEVGYAWGKGIPTVLLAREATELRFDVKGQRCLMYNSIRKLETSLTSELKALTG